MHHLNYGVCHAIFLAPWSIACHRPILCRNSRVLIEQRLLLFYFIFYWSIVDLQSCVSFRCTQSESVIHTHISSHFFKRFFSLYNPLQSIFQIYFSLKDNCFTMLCWFLPYISMNQSWVYICSLPIGTRSHLPPYPTFLGCPRAPIHCRVLSRVQPV